MILFWPKRERYNGERGKVTDFAPLPFCHFKCPNFSGQAASFVLPWLGNSQILEKSRLFLLTIF